jgi:thiamine pyrophosphate-dependent acetolactate synthase large subunit-like protein
MAWREGAKMDLHACLERLAALIRDELVVVALGRTTDEWARLAPRDANLFNVPMGSNLPLAVGLAYALPHRTVVLLDTDGCQLMTLGAVCTLGNLQPPNLRVFVFDNASYARTAALPSATAGRTDLAAIARGAGVGQATAVADLDAFDQAARAALAGDSLTYTVVKIVAQTGRANPWGFDHVENKYRFVRYVERTERRRILPPD